MRSALLLCALAGLACGGGGARDAGGDLPATDPSALAVTLGDLMRMGERRVGSQANVAASTYLQERMRLLGLDVRIESFHVPRHDLRGASLALTVDGSARDLPFEVFEGSGPGQVDDVAVVKCGSATALELEGLDLQGKVALVSRSLTFHRSSQYRNVAARGARAMLYISDAPANLRQVGSVRRTFEALGPIPALSLGADDGAALLAAASVRASVAVDAVATPASGHNVVGRIAGAIPDQIVVGAHYDSWFIGANDNGAGVAALLALAERLAKRPAPRHTLVFVAYDGEETGLYGGYDYMHRHLGQEPITALLGFEVPAPREATLLGFGRSNHAALDDALRGAGVRGYYPIYVNMDAVPALFGGIIPTDLQGLYRAGVPSATTATSYAYYHTREDLPDKVDTAMLAEVVDTFDAAIRALDGAPGASLTTPDPALWRATATATPTAGRLAVSAVITDAAGVARAAAPVEAQLLTDDFTLSATASATTDAEGRAILDLPDVAAPNRFLHLTSGPTYPLVETVVRLP